MTAQYSQEQYSAENPHPFYAWLCAAGPVHRIPLPDGTKGWLITRYSEARVVLSDPRLQSEPPSACPLDSAAAQSAESAGKSTSMDPLPVVDSSRESEMRGTIAAVFTHRRIQEMRPRIQRIADELLDALAGRGQAELVEEFAFPLAGRTLCELLGVPEADQDDFRSWLDVILARVPVDQARRHTVLTQLHEYLVKLIADRRRSLGEDVLSAIISSWDSGRPQSEVELLRMAFLPVSAGYDTVASVISNGMLALLGNPAQLVALRADPSLIPRGVEELLRHTAVVERSKWRWATDDLKIGSVTIRRGELVVIAMAAANRDPRRFADPDTLDVRRTGAAHLSFGYGSQYCPGARMGRTEVEIAIGSLVRRFDDLELAAAPEDLPWRSAGPWRADGNVRGVGRLPVRFTPQRAGLQDQPS